MHSDRNSKRIVEALREAGCRVAYIDPEHRNGQGGIPDLLVGIAGRTVLLEVKAPGKSTQLTDKQKDWHAKWNGGPLAIVTTEVEALIAVGLTP